MHQVINFLSRLRFKPFQLVHPLLKIESSMRLVVYVVGMFAKRLLTSNKTIV